MATNWTERLAHHRTGLAALSFAESTVVPIPLETIVAPLMVGQHRHATTIALSIWIGCLLGASFFFVVGLWLADPVVRPVLEMLGLAETFSDTADDLEGSGLFWSVFLISFTPAPMQLATLGAGAVQGNYLVFIAAIALSRGLRYFGLAILAHLFGPRIASFDLPMGWLIGGMVAIAVVVWAIIQVV